MLYMKVHISLQTTRAQNAFYSSQDRRSTHTIVLQSDLDARHTIAAAPSTPLAHTRTNTTLSSEGPSTTRKRYFRRFAGIYSPAFSL